MAQILFLVVFRYEDFRSAYLLQRRFAGPQGHQDSGPHQLVLQPQDPEDGIAFADLRQQVHRRVVGDEASINVPAVRPANTREMREIIKKENIFFSYLFHSFIYIIPKEGQESTIIKPKQIKPSSTMPNFHIRAVFFVMDSIMLLILLKVNKLNLFHIILY